MSTPQHRTGSVTHTVRDAAGNVMPGAPVTIEFARHDFGFGNIGFDLVAHANNDSPSADAAYSAVSPEHVAALADLWMGLFNHVTLPFYWRWFEPTEGQPETERIRTAARWFRDRGATVKGHPLVWHTLAPKWLMDRSDAEVDAAIRARIRREVGAFAGTVQQWDAINEAVILPTFTAEDNAVTRLARSKGSMEMVRMAFEEARAADPSATLVLNDFDLSEDYENLIEECLGAGIIVDAIGLQTHMHQGFRGEDQINEILERFARFDLPLQLTETTLLSGDLMPGHIVDLNDYQVQSWPSTDEGEARQADDIERHYRTAFSHPLVTSLTYWGITDEGAWLNAPGGLVRLDGTPKPSYDTLHSLIKDEWWTPPAEAVTSAQGTVAIEGVAGTYRVTCGGVSTEVVVPRTPARQ